jgi:TM2 domain-containing membrane protein YozV
MTENTAAKSRTTYILLALFFGVIGIHNFYSGHKKHGIIKIVLFFLCVGLLVNSIWAIIEMITVTKDSEGNQFA